MEDVVNPVIIIPTYVSGGRKSNSSDILGTYDHMTPLSHQGELPRCLGSLRENGIDAPIAILVVSEAGCAAQAGEKIVDIAKHYPTLSISVITAEHEGALHTRMSQMGLGSFLEGIALARYGSIRNLGMIYALTMGYTEAIFIDDDEIITDPEFIDKACYGLGMLTQSGVPILIKTGYYLNKSGDFHAKLSPKWYDKKWNLQRTGFNTRIDSAMGSSRLSVSSTACGGLLAIHCEAMKRVSFDPWITRGEDLDYLLNVRMYGSEIWFDNEWHVIHRPPVRKNELIRYRQDMYRWLFENRKLEFLSSQIDLLQINAEMLEPYPGIMLGKEGEKILKGTALRRAIGCSGKRKAYWNMARKELKNAKAFAAEQCVKYFPFQHQWPEVVAMLTEDIALRGIFESAVVTSAQAELVEDADGEVVIEEIVAAPAVADEEVQRELADFDLDLESLGLDDIDV